MSPPRRAYYNEIDPYAAQWLQNLMDAGCITPGVIDTRSICDVSPADLVGFQRVHWFAGIGGWEHALQLAGWGDEPVWTGSCPCQPFSNAGQKDGVGDGRHLWPAWFRIIQQCRPAIVFGEQVSAAIRYGWLDLVFADMEGADYACAAAVLPAAGVGAPHIRNRLYWVADAHGARSAAGLPEPPQRQPGHTRIIDHRSGEHAGAGWRSALDGMDHADHARLEGYGRGHSPAFQRAGPAGSAAAPGESVQLAHAHRDGLQASPLAGLHHAQHHAKSRGGVGAVAHSGRPHASHSFWGNADWLACRDGKWRPVEPGTQPLVDGVPKRVGKLRAYGNAVVPQVAAAFIDAWRSISTE